MKIALLGYGKMGKVIEEIALNRNHEIVLKINNQNQDQLTIGNLEQVDVAIDFSTPNSAKSNILIAINSNTGWLESYDEVSKVCIDKKSAFLYASNFSLGVNLFFELNKTLAGLMKSQKQYDVNMTEIHHTQKLDAPSGTAISLAEQIISENDYQNGWTLDKFNSDQRIIIDAQRVKMTPGTHIINYKSEVDTISIKHEAHSRKGFALGAVIAAEWIQNKKGVFSMRDVLFHS